MKPKIETVKSKWQGIAKRKKILVAIALALVLATTVVGGAKVYALAANGLNLSVNVERETPLIAGIDEYIRTDADGNIKASSGNDSEYYQYYRMANIRIEGYANTGMKGFVLTTTNCEQIEILSATNAQIDGNRIAEENGTGTVFRWVDEKEDETLVSNLQDGEKGKVVVLFNKPITVKELQEFLRTQVVVKPLAGTGITHTMQVTILTVSQSQTN